MKELRSERVSKVKKKKKHMAAYQEPKGAGIDCVRKKTPNKERDAQVDKHSSRRAWIEARTRQSRTETEVPNVEKSKKGHEEKT